MACAAALGAGILLAGGRSAPAGAGGPPYLMDLHLHGSLSEHTSTMRAHTLHAEQFGYDGLWWTDHMDRVLRARFPFSCGFEQSLEGPEIPGVGPKNWFVAEEEPGTNLALSYAQGSAAAGSHHLVVDFAAEDAPRWQESRLVLHGENRGARTSVLSAPRITVQARDGRANGQAGFLLRCVLSSEPDGATADGTPWVIEFVPGNFQPPPPVPQTVRVPVGHLRRNQWTQYVLEPAVQAAASTALGEDASQHRFELVFFGRNGGSISVAVDDFHFDVTGFADLDLFREQERHLQQHLSQTIFHYVGCEIAGPWEQEVTEWSTRDHLIALYDGTPPELETYFAGRPLVNGYPRTSVDWIRGHGGVAILAHVFGAYAPPQRQSQENADVLARRVVTERGWGADGIEIGYADRGRPLEDFVTLWDALSARGVWITGVGSSDDHRVLSWDRRSNRMGSWLRATDTTAPALMKAIRSGQVFFGDPHVFDPEGDLRFGSQVAGYDMGDVVRTAGGSESLDVLVDGARAGDQLVFLQNGAEVSRWTFSRASLTVHTDLTVQPGDWLRLEVRDPQDRPYLFSNPIYYAAPGTAIPPDRDPGP